ncbi:NAD(P) transhydrogenase subunit alpha [Antarcticirhabdus aurantiaca]|uniref:NAD(P) transhydrogenase subunit alpha n=1 Tax=Antarcticirhabdus aurantiaca TaxID=2606717 RepID=A0ACD4NUJ6_9HYPH|nr:NAD(P) transhydrogenase subunit alpha [Antarcticirhabdus aurantiaca]WAJ30267.1 NAD(P) transhydrogenase subunit alpha [Jeongeuplla avenae]
MESEPLADAVDKLNAAGTAVRDARLSVEQLAGSGIGEAVHAATGIDPFVFHLAIFVLAIFVGYSIVWSVTPALHTPLMSLTNAIASVIVVGALLAVGISATGLSTTFGFVALVLAAVNLVGGFLVTQRMLAMYKTKDR